MAVLVLFIAVSTVQVGAAGDAATTPVDREAARKQAAAELARDVVSGYEIARGGDGSVPLDRHPEPILRWSNPAAGSIYGDVYLWTSEGRPAVVASVYRWYDPHRSQVAELHSLSSESISLACGGSRIWTPSAGVAFRDVDESPSPAASAAGRLRQLRALAAEFSVELEDTRSGAEAVGRRLRLLSQPVFRYGGDTAVTDGALFAFVEGTDPEAWLLLEAVPEAGTPQWRYAFARMNNDVLRGIRRGAEVWRAERTEDALQKPEKSPYALFFVTEIPWQDVPASGGEAEPRE